MNEKNDTICALSTPDAMGGLAVIRVSGSYSFTICDKIVKQRFSFENVTSHSCIYGKIYDNEVLIDDCIFTVFRAPRTFTGEHTVEISCHGSTAVTRKILRLLIKSGARMAKNGEFTRRAFENGKLSLLDAEAIAEVIGAETEKELLLVNTLRDGKTFKSISKTKNELLDICSKLAVWADYPDDYQFLQSEMTTPLSMIIQKNKELLDTYDYGAVVRNGVKTVIIGKPNVGKSSILNALVGYERAIVTDNPGTTRDVLTEKINIGSVILNISDTAGIRNTPDEIEQIGVEFAKKELKTADLILAVFDGSKPLDENDAKIIWEIKDKNVIFILNKSDINSFVEMENSVHVSAKNGDISELIEAISTKTNTHNTFAGVIVNERQRECLASSLYEMEQALNAIKEGQNLDIVSVLLDNSCDKLLELTGERITDSIADRVFEKFCVGK